MPFWRPHTSINQNLPGAKNQLLFVNTSRGVYEKDVQGFGGPSPENGINAPVLNLICCAVWYVFFVIFRDPEKSNPDPQPCKRNRMKSFNCIYFSGRNPFLWWFWTLVWMQFFGRFMLAGATRSRLPPALYRRTGLGIRLLRKTDIRIRLLT